MRYLMTTILAITLGLGLTSQANATLIGDNVVINYNFPDINTTGFGGGPFNRVVTADASDIASFFGGAITVNVGANNIVIVSTGGAVTPAAFNGVLVEDMDWVDSPGSIVGLNINTGLIGWNDSFASFTSDSVAINFGALENLNTFTMTVDLITRHEVSEPATLGLFGGALMLLGLMRRTNKQ